MTQPLRGTNHAAPAALPRFCVYVPMERKPATDGDADTDGEIDALADRELDAESVVDALRDRLAVLVCVEP